MFGTKNERLLLFVGIMIGLLIAAPLILLTPMTSPPNQYEVIIVENKFVYNDLYQKYVGEVGSAIDGDVAVQIEFNLTDTVYKNVGILLIGDENINIYVLCFYNNNKATIQIEQSPYINEWYEMTEMQDLLGVIIFYHRESSSMLEVATWLW